MFQQQAHRVTSPASVTPAQEGLSLATLWASALKQEGDMLLFHVSVGVSDRTASSTRLQMCCQSPWYPVKDGDLVMIASNFVSCYRCAGEGSDLSCAIFGWGGGVGLSRPSGAFQAEPEPAIGSASFIFFDIFFFLIYTAVTFKIQSRGWI